MKLFFSRPPHLPAMPPGVPAGLASDVPGPRRPSDSDRSIVSSISPDFLADLFREYGPTVSFYSRGDLHLLFTLPSDVAEILVEKNGAFMKGEQEAAISSAIGWGLLADESVSHKNHQRELRPAFRAIALDGYMQAVVRTADEWVNRIIAEPQAPLVRTLRCFTQQSAERSLFDVDAEPTNFSYQDSVLAINDFVISALSAERDGPAAIAAVRQYQHHRGIITNHVDDLVRRWRSGETTSTAFFDYVTNEHSEGDFGPFHQQVSLFLQAATETTASLLSWVFLYLNRNPQYWAPLIDEAERAGHIEGVGDLNGLPLNNAVIKEVLRLSPPAWMLPRIATEDIRIGAVDLLAGTKVIVSPWVTHRNPNVFEDSNDFKPERWLRGQEVKKGGYFPFGLGERICIGERFGKMTASVFVHALVRQCFFATVSEDDLTISSSAVILNPRHELRLSISRYHRLEG